MWQGKKKALTFSFDDGVTQDARLIELFNKYGLKGTFNLNSALFGRDYSFDHGGKWIDARKLPAEKIRETYEGHEVAVHTARHPRLCFIGDEEVYREIDEDRKTLTSIVGYDVRGMAYPGREPNHDDRVVEIVKKCGIRYARGVRSTLSLVLQKDLLRFQPTVSFREREESYRLAEEFLNGRTDEPQLLYIWGHAHEIDIEEDGWENIERLCALLANREDVFYGTNTQVFFE